MTVGPEMSLRQFARQRRFLLISIASWVVMVMLLFSVVIPQFQDIQYLQTRLEAEQVTAAQLKNKLQFLDAFDLNGFKGQNDRLNVMLPSTKPFLPLLFSLKELAKQEDVVFSGLDWSIGLVASDSAAQTAAPTSGLATKGPAPASNESLQKMSLVLKVLGSTDKLNGYFDAMTRITPVVEIDDVTLAPKFQIQAGIYEATLKLTAFYAPLTSLRTTVVGDKPLPKLTTDESGYVSKLNEYITFTEQINEGPLETPTARANPFAF